MKLPALKDPQRYEGYFVFDFGEWVSVGFTAREIAVLLASKDHGTGTAYRIHRVDEAGRLEMAAVTERDLHGDDVLVFASSDSRRTGADFASLRELAERAPLPCPGQLDLVDIPGFEPPHAVCLIYPRHASQWMSNWLTNVGFAGGDRVFGGGDTLDAYRQSGARPIATCSLKERCGGKLRSEEEILGAVQQPIQR